LSVDPGSERPDQPGVAATADLCDTHGDRVTVLDGVFTSAQALRGGGLYNENCASCHGQDFMGDEMAPSIAGNDFIVFWTEVPVGSLFERIKVSMPADDPGRLSDEEYTDVLAYLLEASSYPSGESELPADKAALDQIMIVAPAE